MKSLVKLAALVLLFASCGEKNKNYSSEPLRVKTETARLHDDPSAFPYIGTVEPYQRTLVSFPKMALLTEVHVKEGQAVRKGQLLARVDNTQAKNALAGAKAALDQALDAQARMKQLRENNALPEIKWVEVEQKVLQAQSAYDMAKKNLEDCVVYAPVSGVIGADIMHVGETVLPTEPMLMILSIDKVYIKVRVPEKEIARIQPESTSATTIDAIPGETFVGTSVEKGVVADLMSHTYEIRVPIDNPDHRMLPGMVAKMVVNNENASRLSLPVRAVQYTGEDGKFVWTVKDNIVKCTPVVVGAVMGNRIAIESGLQEGEQVITAGYQKVVDGSQVIIVEQN